MIKKLNRLIKSLSIEPPKVTLSVHDSGMSTPLIDVLKSSLEDALQCKGKLPSSVLKMNGMSGKKYRIFINNVIERTADARYLEIGSWAGSTLCSAIHGNSVRATAIDNWSEFGGPMSEFFLNLSRNCGAKTRVNVLTEDFRAVRYDTIGKFNVYMFDGPHQYQDQFDALAYPLPCMDKQLIFIVDDWNSEEVRKGTFDAISALNLSVLFNVEIRTTLDNSHPRGRFSRQRGDWHNGYFLSVLQRDD